MVQYTYTPGCDRVSREWGTSLCRVLLRKALDSMARFYLENMLYFQTSASAALNIHDDPLLFHDLPTPQEAGLRGTL